MGSGLHPGLRSIGVPPGLGPGGRAGFQPPVVGPRLTPSNFLAWPGGHVISNSSTYRNTSIAVSLGDLVIAPGGSLLLDNVSLMISEAVGGVASPLRYGVTVDAGGSLTIKYAAVSSASGPSDPAYLTVDGPARFLHVGFSDLGGSGGSPVSGRVGVDVRSPGVTFEGVVFQSTYQVLFDGPGAVGDAINGSAWLNSTITGGPVGWAQVSGGASWTNLTHDWFAGAQDAGVLALVSGPHVTISNSTLIGDPMGTQPSQVLLTYNGWSDTGIDASYAAVVNDRFQTANLGIIDGSHYTIEGNTINNTGLWASTDGAAAILVVTWIGSGPGLVTRQVDIERNVISNFTHYAIRVSQNVSGFNVSANRIFDSRSTYSNAITEADGIYLIRGVNNGTVWANRLDMTDRVQPSEPTNGIVLEAQVNYVNVSANRIFNCSEVGITVQGDSGALWAPPYFLGPSERNVLFGNWVENFHGVSAQTMYSTEAIETWMWANGTDVIDNVIGGWANVSTGNYWNGAALLTSSSEQRVQGNTISQVRFGFVFKKFDDQQELKSLGSFNRSFNTLIGNAVSGATVDTLVEDAKDDMGPIVNILSGPVDPTWTFWFSGSNATVRIAGGLFTSLAAASPYRAANVQFVGSVGISALPTTFYLRLSQWVGTFGQVGCGALSLSLPKSASEYDAQPLSCSASGGPIAWVAQQVHRATDTIQFLNLVPGVVYTFLVDGAVVAGFMARSSTQSLSWTGSGSHTFTLL